MLAKKLMGAGGNLAPPWSLGNSYDFGDNNSSKYFLLGSGWSGGNPDKWTFSAWVKLPPFSYSNKMLFTAGVDIDDYAYIQINNTGRVLYFTGRAGGTDEYVYTTNSSQFTAGVWYHVVVAYDPTQSVTSAKCAIYINNSAVSTTVSSTPTTTYGYINENIVHAVGVRNRPGAGTDSYFRGKMADINFVDGEYLTPSAFAEDVGGVWTPKQYTGSYGTTGFRLNFEDDTSATTLGYDVSGNGHDATPYNIVTSDVSTDVPG